MDNFRSCETMKYMEIGMDIGKIGISRIQVTRNTKIMKLTCAATIYFAKSPVYKEQGEWYWVGRNCDMGEYSEYYLQNWMHL